MSEALLLVGSNVERFKNISAAIERLRKIEGIRVLRVSNLYESEDVKGQCPSYLNASVWLETDLPLVDLRRQLRSIEGAMGRVRTAGRAALCSIDLDISLYDDTILDIDGTKIPDPDIYRYPHAVIPLAQICPNWPHPQTGERLADIASNLDCQNLRAWP